MGNDVVERIKDLLEKIRPYLRRDGGDLEFVNFEDGVVYVKMLGACMDCASIDTTLKLGIEQILASEIEEVKEVVNIGGTPKQFEL